MKRRKQPKPKPITQRPCEGDHAWYGLLLTTDRLLEHCAACGAERWTPLGKQRLKEGQG